MNYILDTNVISELVAAQPTPEVLAWLDGLDPQSVYLSVITIGELKKGIEKLQGSKRKKELESWLSNDLLLRFKDRVLNLDTPVLLRWGTMAADLERKGRPLPALDLLLAATASQAGYTLATRNTLHFEATGISAIDPWRVDAG